MILSVLKLLFTDGTLRFKFSKSFSKNLLNLDVGGFPLTSKKKHTHTHTPLSPPALKSLHLSPRLKRVWEWMCHNYQWRCHGDSRVVWAGFLSWPLVKQTSKVARQRRSLVLTASFTSSTAFSTSAFGKFIGRRRRPPPSLRRCRYI